MKSNKKTLSLALLFLLSTLSLGISINKVQAQAAPPFPIPPVQPLPDPLPLPPPPDPPKPLEDLFKDVLPRPWVLELSKDNGLFLGRDCNCKGFKFTSGVFVNGGLDDKRTNVDIKTGIGIKFDFFSQNNIASPNNAGLQTFPYVIGSIDDPTTIIFGDLSFEQSSIFNPLSQLSAFDINNNGTYIFQDAQAFTSFLDSSVTCPESSCALSLLALGTLGAGATLKRKLKTSSADKELGKIS